MQKKFVWCLRIAFSIIGAILSLLLAHYFNLFSLIKIIPEEKVYDVCITFYFSLTGLLLNGLLDLIEKKVSDYYMDVEAILSHRNEVPGLSSQPTIRFNECDMSEVALTIRINGDRAFFSDVKVIIPKISQAEYQPGRKSLGASLSSEGDFCIDLSAICGQSQKVNMSETFLITLQRAPIDDNAEITLTPEITPKKSKRIRFFNNSAVIELGVKLKP